MIVDRIEEQERYYPLHPDMELAFAFLAEAPIWSLAAMSLKTACSRRFPKATPVRWIPW